MFAISSADAGRFPSNTVVMNTPRYGRYKTAEVSMSKRYGNKWSAQVGGSHTWLTNFANGLYPNNPNMPGVNDRTTFQFKIAATYDGPWGLKFAPLLRHQSGVNYARELTISVPAGTAPAGVTYTATSGSGARATAYADDTSANREDNIWVFDIRTEKSVNFTDRIRTRLYLDLFNLTNSHASETITRSTGLSYQKPALILAPFTARVGFRFIF
jgi:hypothetical protein